MRGHKMPPPLHLFDIRCNCFPYRRCHGKQKGAINERTNEAVYVGFCNILYKILRLKIKLLYNF